MSSALPELLLFSSSFGSLDQLALALGVVLVAGLQRRADDLGRANAVDALGIGAHESLSAAGDDVGAVAARAQQAQHLLHRLVDQLGVGAVPAMVLGLVRPIGRDRVERLDRHPGMGREHDRLEVAQGELADRRAVAGQHGLERLLLLPLGMLGRQRHHPVEREHHLAVDRVLDPQRAVLVEGGEPVLERDEVRAAGLRGGTDQVEDSLLGRAGVPGRQRVGLLRQDGCARKRQNESQTGQTKSA